MKSTILTFIILVAVNSYSVSVSAQGYGKDVLDFHLYEKAEYKKITKNNIDRYLPLKEIDLTPFKELKTLNFLGECDFCQISNLNVGPFVSDFELLKNNDFVKSIRFLDLSNSLIRNSDLLDVRMINLTVLDISGLQLEIQNIILSFPNLKKLVVRPNQFDQSDISKIESVGMRISFSKLLPLPRKFYTYEIKQYSKRFFFSESDRHFKNGVFEIQIGRLGNVLAVDSQEEGNNKSMEDMIKRILYFDPDSSFSSVNYIVLPLVIR